MQEKIEAAVANIEFPEGLKDLERYLADFRSAPPVYPHKLNQIEYSQRIDSIREGVGLLRFSWEGLNRLYRKLENLLKDETLTKRQREVFSYYLLQLEGLIHITATLMKEYSTIWASLRSHELALQLEQERKVSSSYNIPEGRRKAEAMKEKIRNLDKEKLQKLSKKLKPKEQLVLEKHILEKQPITALAQEMGISKQRVQQICREVLKKAEALFEDVEAPEQEDEINQT